MKFFYFRFLTLALMCISISFETIPTTLPPSRGGHHSPPTRPYQHTAATPASNDAMEVDHHPTPAPTPEPRPGPSGLQRVHQSPNQSSINRLFYDLSNSHLHQFMSQLEGAVGPVSTAPNLLLYNNPKRQRTGELSHRFHGNTVYIRNFMDSAFGELPREFFYMRQERIQAYSADYEVIIGEFIFIDPNFSFFTATGSPMQQQSRDELEQFWTHYDNITLERLAEEFLYNEYYLQTANHAWTSEVQMFNTRLRQMQTEFFINRLTNSQFNYEQIHRLSETFFTMYSELRSIIYWRSMKQRILFYLRRQLHCLLEAANLVQYAESAGTPLTRFFIHATPDEHMPMTQEERFWLNADCQMNALRPRTYELPFGLEDRLRPPRHEICFPRFQTLNPEQRTVLFNWESQATNLRFSEDSSHPLPTPAPPRVPTPHPNLMERDHIPERICRVIFRSAHPEDLNPYEEMPTGVMREEIRASIPVNDVRAMLETGLTYIQYFSNHQPFSTNDVEYNMDVEELDVHVPVFPDLTEHREWLQEARLRLLRLGNANMILTMFITSYFEACHDRRHFRRHRRHQKKHGKRHSGKKNLVHPGTADGHNFIDPYRLKPSTLKAKLPMTNFREDVNQRCIYNGEHLEQQLKHLNLSFLHLH